MDADGTEGGADATKEGGKRLLGAFEAVRRLGEKLQVAEEFGGRRSLKSRSVDHHEVLGLSLRVGQSVTGNAQDLQGKTPRKADVVRKDVPCVRGHPHVDFVPSRSGEDALGQFLRKSFRDDHFAVQYAVRLCVHGSDGVAIIFGGALEDNVESIIQTADHFLFVVGMVLDGRREQNWLIQGHEALHRQACRRRAASSTVLM